MGKQEPVKYTLDELFNKQLSLNEKTISIKSLKELVKNYKKNNIKVGFTNGCFDILHIGHIRYLEESKRLCDKLIIAINSDLSVKQIKGKNRPINNQVIRKKILSALRIADHVIIFNESTPINLIKSQNLT